MSYMISYTTRISDLKTGLISQANGSAYIETEKTKIACAVSVLEERLMTCGVLIFYINE